MPFIHQICSQIVTLISQTPLFKRLPWHCFVTLPAFYSMEGKIGVAGHDISFPNWYAHLIKLCLLDIYDVYIRKVSSRSNNLGSHVTRSSRHYFVTLSFKVLIFKYLQRHDFVTLHTFSYSIEPLFGTKFTINYCLFPICYTSNRD